MLPFNGALHGSVATRLSLVALHWATEDRIPTPYPLESQRTQRHSPPLEIDCIFRRKAFQNTLFIPKQTTIHMISKTPPQAFPAGNGLSCRKCVSCQNMHFLSEKKNLPAAKLTFLVFEGNIARNTRKWQEGHRAQASRTLADVLKSLTITENIANTEFLTT